MRDFLIALGSLLIALGLVKLIISAIQYRKGKR